MCSSDLWVSCEESFLDNVVLCRAYLFFRIFSLILCACWSSSCSCPIFSMVRLCYAPPTSSSGYFLQDQLYVFSVVASIFSMYFSYRQRLEEEEPKVPVSLGSSGEFLTGRNWSGPDLTMGRPCSSAPDGRSRVKNLSRKWVLGTTSIYGCVLLSGPGTTFFFGKYSVLDKGGTV